LNSSPLYSSSDDPHCGDTGNQYRDSGGSPVALGSTGAHGVRVKLVSSHRGATPLTEMQLFTGTIKYR
jgi:hypothetical protein